MKNKDQNKSVQNRTSERETRENPVHLDTAPDSRGRNGYQIDQDEVD